MPDNLLSTVRRNYKKREQESRIGDEPNGFVMWAFFDRMHRRSRRVTTFIEFRECSFKVSLICLNAGEKRSRESFGFMGRR